MVSSLAQAWNWWTSALHHLLVIPNQVLVLCRSRFQHWLYKISARGIASGAWVSHIVHPDSGWIVSNSPSLTFAGFNSLEESIMPIEPRIKSVGWADFSWIWKESLILREDSRKLRSQEEKRRPGFQIPRPHSIRKESTYQRPFAHMLCHRCHLV